MTLYNDGFTSHLRSFDNKFDKLKKQKVNKHVRTPFLFLQNQSTQLTVNTRRWITRSLD